MGRGSRGQEQALRIKAIPRRLSRPKRVGQKRYSVIRYNHNNGKISPEPGRLRTLNGSMRTRPPYSVAVLEEIAVLDNQGKLRWIEQARFNEKPLYDQGTLSAVRKSCDRLNQEPLGPAVSQEVNGDGLLVIGLQYSYRNGFAKPEKEVSEAERFDVTDPVQAEKAKTHYEKIAAQVEEKLTEEADKAILRLKLDDPEKAKQLFSDNQIADKSNKAQAFADALKSGKADEIIEEVEQSKSAAEAAEAAAAQASQSERAARARETIRSLAGS